LQEEIKNLKNKLEDLKINSTNITGTAGNTNTASGNCFRNNIYEVVSSAKNTEDELNHYKNVLKDYERQNEEFKRSNNNHNINNTLDREKELIKKYSQNNYDENNINIVAGGSSMNVSLENFRRNKVKLKNKNMYRT
jgi:hypothetical protein